MYQKSIVVVCWMEANKNEWRILWQFLQALCTKWREIMTSYKCLTYCYLPKAPRKHFFMILCKFWSRHFRMYKILNKYYLDATHLIRTFNNRMLLPVSNIFFMHGNYEIGRREKRKKRKADQRCWYRKRVKKTWKGLKVFQTRI